jgi:hypothetical protein
MFKRKRDYKEGEVEGQREREGVRNSPAEPVEPPVAGL